MDCFGEEKESGFRLLKMGSAARVQRITCSLLTGTRGLHVSGDVQGKKPVILEQI
jgi:hypothetical protein